LARHCRLMSTNDESTTETGPRPVPLRLHGIEIWADSCPSARSSVLRAWPRFQFVPLGVHRHEHLLEHGATLCEDIPVRHCSIIHRQKQQIVRPVPASASLLLNDTTPVERVMRASRGVLFGVAAGSLGASGAALGKLAGVCCSSSTGWGLPLRVLLYIMMFAVIEITCSYSYFITHQARTSQGNSAGLTAYVQSLRELPSLQATVLSNIANLAATVMPCSSCRLAIIGRAT
jgi:hypothetical protein